jgi:hypothetical protein
MNRVRKFKAYDKHTKKRVTDPMSFYMSMDELSIYDEPRLQKALVICWRDYSAETSLKARKELFLIFLGWILCIFPL